MKHTYLNDVQNEHQVTPFVGVWIETLGMQTQYRCELVTPFVGVWIETYIN